jgi:UDP-GlcNAc:undecaprenyl-phosphate GlcNAc-1-phosphate transferase
VSALGSALICSQAGALGLAAGLLDRPDGALKRHGMATPLIGGFALLVPSFAASAVYFVLSGGTSFMIAAIAASTVTLIVGLIDDRQGMSPVARLAMFTGVALAAFAIEPLFVIGALRFGPPDSGIGVLLGVFAVPFTALIIIGFVNAANMADGMNGQFLGSVIIWSLFIVPYLGAGAGMPFFAVICSAAVALVFNLRGRLFSGSSGAYATSIFIALGAIAAYRRSNGAMPAEVPVFWFWLPVADCMRLMVTRRLAGKSPLFGDRNHIHHILQDRMPAPFALAVYLVLLAAPGAASAAANSRLAGLAVLILCLVCYAALVYARGRGETQTIQVQTFVKTAGGRPLSATIRPMQRAEPAGLHTPADGAAERLDARAKLGAGV